jgi:hypothetical protein
MTDDPSGKRFLAVSAITVVFLGMTLAFLVIVGIWTDFQGKSFGKWIGTLSVLFLLSIVLHHVAKGCCDGPKAKL